MTTEKVLAEELGLDPEALRAKYRAERDKRLRPEGLAQFVGTQGQHSHFDDDPYVEQAEARAPRNDEIEIAVVGGGFGGLLLGANLRKAGVEEIRFIDRAGDFGGVWYWNRYPGAACDTEASIYLPLLEELGYLPKRRYAKAPEILEHCRRIARTFDLYRDTCFRTAVTDLRWDDLAGRWIIRTDRGDEMRARYMVISAGPMDRPKLADLPGLETFKGRAFHSSRWDYGYTGGNSDGNLSGLADQVVGIIGTGATAVQCVPHLAVGAKHLYVFQRTPSSVDVRDDGELEPDWVAALEPGWQQKRMENFTALVGGALLDEDLVNDGWTSIPANIRRLLERASALGLEVDNPYSLAPLADIMKMEEIRARVDAVVEDTATAEALKPWYDRFCKRPCFHDGYLPAFNRPNVTLVDTSGRGVERISEAGVVVAGREYALDGLVYSTGFDASSPYAKRISFEITGRDNSTLAEKWANGAATLHGIGTEGFPNLFIMSHVQSGLSLNFSHMIGEQARHIAYILGRAVQERIRTIEVTRQAEEAWVAEIDAAAVSLVEALRECTPSYFNHEGNVSRLNARNSGYGKGALAFYDVIAQWRAEGSMPGLELSY